MSLNFGFDYGFFNIFPWKMFPAKGERWGEQIGTNQGKVIFNVKTQINQDLKQMNEQNTTQIFSLTVMIVQHVLFILLNAMQYVTLA